MMRFTFLLFLLPLLAFKADQDLTQITQAISIGSATTLGQYFDDNVEIALLNEEDVYNKSQAVQKLETFFEKNQPKAFSQVHEGSSKGNASKYCIGNLKTNSEDFRVYMFIDISADQYKIQELRIE
ncbi:MAG: DUF4783 domain-containing protein [Bacteroidota bacterium]